MKHRIPIYLNEQVRFVAGLYSNEFAIIILVVYFSALFRFQWLAVLLNIAFAAVFIWLNRNFPRGFIRHLAYFCGLFRFSNYPEFFANRFIE